MREQIVSVAEREKKKKKPQTGTSFPPVMQAHPFHKIREGRKNKWNILLLRKCLKYLLQTIFKEIIEKPVLWIQNAGRNV